jgi:transcriptional repressor of cell division inhibition gene dicB
MKKQQVLDYFGGGSAVAAALGIAPPSVTNWSDPLPELRQLQIEQVTEGRLRAGPECDKYRVAPLKDRAPA